MTETNIEHRAGERAEAVLICMPWDMLRYPSLQLGILKNVLKAAGIATAVRQYNLALLDYLGGARDSDGKPRFRVRDAMQITEHYHVGLGDWIFAIPPYQSHSEQRDAEYIKHLHSVGVEAGVIARAREMRGLVPAFLDICVQDIVALKPKVVGFTSAFSQNVPSLVLAKLLKQRAPSLKVVFGGGNCDGVMGETLHRVFPWVDVVVRGEAESIIVDLMRDLLDGGPIRPQPGICFRNGDGRVVVVEQAAREAKMDQVPPPDYDEYFARLERSAFREELAPQVRLLYEGSRGCWWGQKSHCSFCGIRDMAFFSKSPDVMLSELVALAGRYRCLNIDAVDNIIDMRYFETLLPKLRDLGVDFRLFFETKANLKRQQVKLFRDAGVRSIQPGIESLSTPILRLMRKGVTAMQNVRLLKWCAQYGVNVAWNLIYGFPGEPPEEYESMAGLLKLLTHFRAPDLNRLHLDRFSPYHERPYEHGIEVTGPLAHYRFLYPVDEQSLMKIAYHFEYRHVDGRDAERYVAPVREVIEAWKRAGPRDYRSLRFRRGPGFMIITDGRIHTGPSVITLGSLESKVYLAADAGGTADKITAALESQREPGATPTRVKGILEEFVAAGIMMREGKKYLALAVAENPEAVPQVAAEAEHDQPAVNLVQLQPPSPISSARTSDMR